MIVILEKLDVAKKSLFLLDFLFKNKISLCVFDKTNPNIHKTIVVPICSSNFKYFFNFENVNIILSNFVIKVTFQENSITQDLCEEVKFIFEKITVILNLKVNNDGWRYFDSNINQRSKIYKGREYYVEETLKSCFDCPLKSDLGFIKTIYNNKIYYVDKTNKIVLGTPPEIKQGNLRRKVQSLQEGSQYSNMKITIRRSNIVEDSIVKLLPCICDGNIDKFYISFDGEIGQDYGAIKKEYFHLLLKELIKNKRFLRSDFGIVDVEGRLDLEFIYSYDPSKSSLNLMKGILCDIYNDSEPDDPRLFYMLLGATVGASLLLGHTININLSLGFYENLLDRNYCLRHIQDVELQNNILKVLNDHQFLMDSSINDQIFYSLLYSKINQYDFIRFGFNCVFKKQLSKELVAFDFPLIFNNYYRISINEIKELVIYEKCSLATSEIKWLWEILEMKDYLFFEKFLQFITGSDSLSMFKADSTMFFEKISCIDELFRASSCTNKLYIPSFSSKEKMNYYLDYSILNTEGFHKI